MAQVTRRDIRIKVMQVLYAHIISGDPIEKVKKDLLDEIKMDENLEFGIRLIDIVLKNEEMLDSYILDNVVNWELERMAFVDRLVLRMAIGEMIFFPDIPPKVSINEAIEISKEYCTRNSGRFVNGILDSVLAELKKSDKLIKTGRGLINVKSKDSEKKDSKKQTKNVISKKNKV